MRSIAMTVALLCSIQPLWSAPSALGAERPEWQIVPFNTLAHDLRLTIDYDSETLRGISRLTIANSTDSSVQVVPMLLYRLLKVEAVKDENGMALPYTQEVRSFVDYPQLQENVIEVELAEAVGPGQTTTLTVEYGGHLLGRTEVWGYVRDRIDRDFTIIREDCSAYPAIGVPSMRLSRSKILQRYVYSAEITVPSPMVVANGGELVGRTENDGWISYSYRSIKPSWRMDFAIADYRLVKEGANRVFCLREDAARGDAILAALSGSMKLYSEWFGPLKDSVGMTVIEIPDHWGSQTDVTTIIQTAASFKDDARLYELYHEVSHLWNVKPRDEVAPRLEEGLACFLQYLTVEELEGRKIVAENLVQTVERIQGIYSKHPEYAAVPIADFGVKDMTDLSYSVGRIFFAVLYELVGARDFNEIIGTFYQKYFETGATTEEFLSHLQHMTEVDLTPLFNDWIRGHEYSTMIRNGDTVAAMAKRYNGDGE